MQVLLHPVHVSTLSMYISKIFQLQFLTYQRLRSRPQQGLHCQSITSIHLPARVVSCPNLLLRLLQLQEQLLLWRHALTKLRYAHSRCRCPQHQRQWQPQRQRQPLIQVSWRRQSSSISRNPTSWPCSQ